LQTTEYKLVLNKEVTTNLDIPKQLLRIVIRLAPLSLFQGENIKFTIQS